MFWVLLYILAGSVLLGSVALAIWYRRLVYRILAKRHQEKPLAKVEHQRISSKSLRALTHNFTEGEDAVYWADRQHPISFWLPTISLLVIGGICLGLAVLIALYLHTIKLPALPVNGTQKPEAIRITFLGYFSIIPLLVSVVALFGIWNLWLQWKAVVRLITNKSLLLENQPWAWAAWLWSSEKHDPQPLEHIVSVEHKSTFFGRVFGYGTITVKTYLQDTEDEEFREIKLVPLHEEFSNVLDGLRIEAQKQLGAPSLLHEVTTAVRNELRRSNYSSAHSRPRRHTRRGVN